MGYGSLVQPVKGQTRKNAGSLTLQIRLVPSTGLRKDPKPTELQSEAGRWCENDSRATIAQNAWQVAHCLRTRFIILRQMDATRLSTRDYLCSLFRLWTFRIYHTYIMEPKQNDIPVRNTKLGTKSWFCCTTLNRKQTSPALPSTSPRTKKVLYGLVKLKTLSSRPKRICRRDP